MTSKGIKELLTFLFYTYVDIRQANRFPIVGVENTPAAYLKNSYMQQEQ